MDQDLINAFQNNQLAKLRVLRLMSDNYPNLSQMLRTHSHYLQILISITISPVMKDILSY